MRWFSIHQRLPHHCAGVAAQKIPKALYFVLLSARFV
jgi:hypothetical protein